jgi:hypothetical protein
MTDGRGLFRGLYSAMVEDYDYQALSSAARLVLLTLRVCPQNTAASMLRLYPHVLMAQTGYRLPVLRGAIAALVKGRWIECEGPWELLSGPCLVWIRNGLRFDPSLRLADRKHRLAVERALAAFGDTPLVARFREYYGITRPLEDPSKGLRRPLEGGNRFGSPSSTPNPRRTRSSTPEEEEESEEEEGAATTPSGAAQSPEKPEGFSSLSIGDTKDGRNQPEDLAESLAAIMRRREELRRAKGYAP